MNDSTMQNTQRAPKVSDAAPSPEYLRLQAEIDALGPPPANSPHYVYWVMANVLVVHEDLTAKEAMRRVNEQYKKDHPPKPVVSPEMKELAKAVETASIVAEDQPIKRKRGRPRKDEQPRP